MTSLQIVQVGAVLTSLSWFILSAKGAFFQSAVDGSARFFYTRCRTGSQSLTTGVQCPLDRVGGGYPPIPLSLSTHVIRVVVCDW